VAWGGNSGDICMFPTKSGNFPAVGGGVQHGAMAAATTTKGVGGFWVSGGWVFFFFFFRLKMYKKKLDSMFCK
jgi:hypothetical protein